MKLILSLVLVFSLFTGCSTSKKDNDISKDELFIKGELFIKLITVGQDVFTIEDEKGITLQEKLEGIQDISSLSLQDKEIKEYFDLLKENNLIGKPYFHLKFRTSDLEFEEVFVSKDEYQKVKDFKLRDLQKDNQKVLLEFYGKPISDGIIICNRITSVKIVQEDTNWKK